MRWATPAWLAEYAVRRWRLDFDACAEPSTAVVPRYATRPGWALRWRGLGRGLRAAEALAAAGLEAPAVADGLRGPWSGRPWLNPPYGRAIGRWCSKAAAEVEAGNVPIVVGLVPSRTDTGWWCDHVVARASRVYFLRGRLRFEINGAPLAGAPFPSALVVWTAGGGPAAFEYLDARKGRRPV